VKEIVGNHPDVIPWLAHHTDSDLSTVGATLGLICEGEIVAAVLYDNYNGANIHATVAGIGKRWLTREYLRAIFHYPFNQLRVKRITAVIADGNHDSIKFAEHLGFTREATLADAHPTGNLFIYVMRRNDCRWLIKEV
jgi:RimJ/RimL family protein N-acetyltransferase